MKRPNIALFDLDGTLADYDGLQTENGTHHLGRLRELSSYGA